MVKDEAQELGARMDRVGNRESPAFGRGRFAHDAEIAANVDERAGGAGLVEGGGRQVGREALADASRVEAHADGEGDRSKDGIELDASRCGAG